jgi:hypothetical protein
MLASVAVNSFFGCERGDLQEGGCSIVSYLPVVMAGCLLGLRTSTAGAIVKLAEVAIVE